MICLILSLSACGSEHNPEAVVMPSLSMVDEARAQGNWQQALLHLHESADVLGWTLAHHEQAIVLWEAIGLPARVDYHTQQAVALESSESLLRRIAQNRIESEDWAGALRCLYALLDHDPVHTWGHLQVALILAPSHPLEASHHLAEISLGDLSERERRLVVTLLPFVQRPDELTPLLVGEHLAQAGYFTYAENAFAYASAWRYPDPLAMAYWGLMRAQQGESFAPLLNEALHQAPDASELYLLAGLAYRLTEQFEISLLHWQVANALMPENAFIIAQMATTYALQGDISRAGFWYDEAVRLAESNDESDLIELIGVWESESVTLSPEALLREIFTVIQEGTSGLDLPGISSRELLP